MPDASGRIRGISVPAEAWDRIFGTVSGWEVWTNVVGGWSWSAYGPRGRETGSAPDRAEAERLAEAAEQRLVEASP